MDLFCLDISAFYWCIIIAVKGRVSGLAKGFLLFIYIITSHISKSDNILVPVTCVCLCLYTLLTTLKTLYFHVCKISQIRPFS